MKRYYTMEVLKNDLNDKLEDRRMDKLQEFISEESHVKYYILTLNYREELAGLGVILLNKQHSIQCFDYGDLDDKSADTIEAKIKDFAEQLSIRLHDVRAAIDYDILLPKICNCLGMQIYNEEVMSPGLLDKEKKIKLVCKYINDLDSKDKTVIITDPYLFKTDIEALTKLLQATKAKKLVFYMPCDNKHYRKDVYQEIEKRLNDIEMEFNQYELCHDRFWLCLENNKGFCMGTSLNGLGSKICRIDKLELTEVETLLAELCK